MYVYRSYHISSCCCCLTTKPAGNTHSREEPTSLPENLGAPQAVRRMLRTQLHTTKGFTKHNADGGAGHGSMIRMMIMVMMTTLLMPNDDGNWS